MCRGYPCIFLYVLMVMTSVVILYLSYDMSPQTIRWESTLDLCSYK